MVHFTEEQYLQFEQAIRVAMEQRDHEADPDSDSESLPDPELMEIKVLWAMFLTSLSAYMTRRTCALSAEDQLTQVAVCCYVVMVSMMSA